jgi:hypothetical protein
MTEAQRRLHRIAGEVSAIFQCQGWQEALASDDPSNVTVWLGPRLHAIQEAARITTAG